MASAINLEALAAAGHGDLVRRAVALVEQDGLTLTDAITRLDTAGVVRSTPHALLSIDRSPSGGTMTPDPIRLQADIERARTLSSQPGGPDFTSALLAVGREPDATDAALLRAAQRPSAPAAPAGADVEWRSLAVDGDGNGLHAVTLAVARHLGAEYLEALSVISTWADTAIPKAGVGSPLMLSDVLAAGNVEPAAVYRLMADHDDEVRTLETATPRPRGSVDDRGQVLLPSGVDRDALLADPLAARRAYRHAIELDLVDPDPGAVVGESEDFADFLTQWRLAVDAGVDLVATLQREQYEQERARLVADGGVAKHDAKVVEARRDRKRTLEIHAELVRRRGPLEDGVA